MPSFTTQLDWADFDAPGQPDGTIHSGVWTANTASGIDISVSAENAGALGARTADNFASVLVGGNWIDRAFVPTAPFAFQGHFDAPPDTAPPSAITPGSPYGDHLMGLATNGSSTAGALLISFSNPLSDIGFRIAAISNNTFDARMQLFTGLGGTGTLISDHTFSGLGGGGTCASLSVSVSNPPSPCNNAPFIGSLNNGLIVQSMILSANDVDGFYIGNLFVTDIPEPAPMILCACGMLLLLAGKNKWLLRKLSN